MVVQINILIMEYFIFCDGSCHNKPGENSTGYAAVLTDRMFATFDNVLNKYTGHKAEGTSNLAEWDALILGMQLMIEHNGTNTDGYNSYHIFTDSDLIANQANGNWRVRKQTFWPVYKKFKALRRQANDCRISYSIKWISRKQNKIADFYSREANPHYPDKQLDKNIAKVRRTAHDRRKL